MGQITEDTLYQGRVTLFQPEKGFRASTDSLMLAAALPDLDYDCGLGTASLLAADVTTQPVRPEHGTIPVRRPAVDESALEFQAAPPDRRRWWRERLTRCHALLAVSQG